MINAKKEAKAITDSLIAGAKSKIEGFGTKEKPSTFVDKNGYLHTSPAADDFLSKKEGYKFLMPEFKKIKGVDYIIGYYLKNSEYENEAKPDGSFTPQADKDHRVYVFGYIRHKKTGDLTQGAYTVKLSPQESQELLEAWEAFKAEQKRDAEIVETSYDENGNAYVFLIPDEESTPKKFYVAELMWKAFKGDVPPGMKITHIDGNKANNNISNLKLEPENKVTG
jgi:hypothetical protein